MNMTVGVIGLGNMGGGMAATLVRKGFAVSGYDLSGSALARAEAQGVNPVAQLDELIARVDLLILSLPKAEHVEALCLGAGGILERGRAGLLVVDTTTSTLKPAARWLRPLPKKPSALSTRRFPAAPRVLLQAACQWSSAAAMPTWLKPGRYLKP